jgi:hypothetical protein
LIDWDKPLTKEQRLKINRQLHKETSEDLRSNFWIDTPSQTDGSSVYGNLGYYIEGKYAHDKNVSLFLKRAGIDGIRFPSNYYAGGNSDGHLNYVVFDAKQIQIVKKEILERKEIISETPVDAYHGTPHSFDKFDAYYIGTGEGHQVFG